MGKFLTVLGHIGTTVVFLLGGIFSIGIVLQNFGIVAGVISVPLMPITFILTPIYVVIEKGSWGLALFSFGGLIVSRVIFMVGAAMLD